MQAENLSYLIQAKSLISGKWVKVFESSDYEKMAGFYKKVKNDFFVFNNNEKTFYLVSKEASNIIFNYQPDIKQISPSRWITIEAVDIETLSDKIKNSLIPIETRFIEIISQTRLLDETTEKT